MSNYNKERMNANGQCCMEEKAPRQNPGEGCCKTDALKVIRRMELDSIESDMLASSNKLAVSLICKRACEELLQVLPAGECWRVQAALNCIEEAVLWGHKACDIEAKARFAKVGGHDGTGYVEEACNAEPCNKGL